MNRFILFLWGCVWLAPIALLSQTTGGDGKLLRTETYRNYTTVDSAAFQRVNYDYPIPTQRVETTYQFEQGLWVAQTRFNTTFDALGRTIESIFERYDPVAKVFYPQVRTQNFPRGNSLSQLDSALNYNWSDAQQGWQLSIVQRNRFNAKNQLTEVETSITFSGQSFRNRNLNFYDANGNNTKTENYTFLNGQFTRTGFTLQVFENNLLRNSTSYSAVSPTDSVPISRILNSYAPSSLLSSTEGFSWDPATKQWKKSNGSVYSYNTKQQLQSLTTTLAAQGEEQKSRFDYYYSAKGSTIRVETYQGSGTANQWKLDTKQFFFYDQASALKEPKTAKKSFKISPNPSVDEVRLDLPWGASFQVFNAGGQLQATGIADGQNQLNIRDWNSGFYWIVARKNAEFMFGKFLKP